MAQGRAREIYVVEVKENVLMISITQKTISSMPFQSIKGTQCTQQLETIQNQSKADSVNHVHPKALRAKLPWVLLKAPAPEAALDYPLCPWIPEQCPALWRCWFCSGQDTHVDLETECWPPLPTAPM